MEKLKNIVLNKRLVAIILLIITMMTNVSQVFAASGSGTYVAGQYGSKVFTTDSYQTTNGMLIRRLVNTTTGKQYTVFCSEHGADIKTGSVYNGEYYTQYAHKIQMFFCGGHFEENIFHFPYHTPSYPFIDCTKVF